MRFPREQWIAVGIDPAVLPDDPEAPDRVPGLYTTATPPGVDLFATVQLTAEGTGMDIRLVVVGAVEDRPSLLYVLDPGTGEVLQFDRSTLAVRGVNSSYRWFVEFLRRIAFTVETSRGQDVREVFTRGMKFTLRAVDDRAFEEGAWWPQVFS